MSTTSVEAAIAAAPDTLTILSPATGEEIATIPASTPEELDRAVLRARTSQPSWAADDDARRQALRALADVTEQHQEELVRLVAQETGKPAMAAQIEPAWAAEHLRWIADVDLPEAGPRTVAGELILEERVPVGVVAAIVPWNVPLTMAVHKFAAAARMGNTVVVKPSPFTPLATRRWAELAAQILPAGVLEFVVGGDDLGRQMTAHPGIDMIGFTGSTATGQSIMKSAAPTLKRIVLELGGNDAAIVLPDADPAQVAEGIFMGSFILSGQVCQAIKRLYVHRSVHDELVEALAGIAEAQVLGTPDEPDTTMGPLTTRAQAERVAELVEDARSRGAVVRTGGRPADRAGYFYEPTIVTHVPTDARLVTEEQFGPALPIIAYDDVDDAVRQANDTDYGLGGSVWSSDPEAAAQVARRLQAGSVWVNAHATIHPAVPFGGVKQSGIGREGGIAGLEAYAETRTVHLPAPSGDAEQTRGL
jgi:acyl-CoA reductase-like NAD-dependent aldehyde dehydrogenase